MNRYSSILSLTAVLVVAFTVCLARGQGNTVTRQIAIGTRGNRCVVTTSPADIVGAKRNFRVVWNIDNECTGARTVTVDNFKHEEDENTIKQPLTLGQPSPVPENGSGQIAGLIKQIPDEDLGTYKYDILIDGEVAEDPRLEIDK